MFNECRETVSILYATIFGANGACVRIDTWSLLSAFAAFIFLVIVAQFVARKAWARLTKTTQIAPEVSQDTLEKPDLLRRGDYESPIRKSKY